MILQQQRVLHAHSNDCECIGSSKSHTCSYLIYSAKKHINIAIAITMPISITIPSSSVSSARKTQLLGHLLPSHLANHV